jgi:hypothetical protein
MNKGQIGWRRKLEDGGHMNCYAYAKGDRWQFFAQTERFEKWEPVKTPPLEDWLCLLDAVDRRLRRMAARPETAAKIRKRIKELFPEAQVPEFHK